MQPAPPSQDPGVDRTRLEPVEDVLRERRPDKSRPFSTSATVFLILLLGGCDDPSGTTAPQLELRAIAGACTRRGGVTFANFLRLLGRHRKVGARHFAPPRVNARVGQELVAVNHGGEVHTFTEVEEEGTELYQCCIHPWMRTVVNARE